MFGSQVLYTTHSPQIKGKLHRFEALGSKRRKICRSSCQPITSHASLDKNRLSSFLQNFLIIFPLKNDILLEKKT